MAKIKMTVTPAKDKQKVFNAGNLAETLKGKKVLLNWFDEFERDAAFLCNKIYEDLPNRMTDKSGTTGNMKKRLGYAKLSKPTVSGTVAGGKHTVEIKVVGIDGEEDGSFPVIVNIEDPPEEPEPVTFEDLVKDGKITFSSTKVGSLIKADKNNKAKATTIFQRGKSYKGHGPTAELGNALHAHVTNKTALGFRFNGDKLEVVGFGVKSDSAGSGTSGYTWYQ